MFPYLKHSRRSCRPYFPAWYACPSITEGTVSESSTITATSLSLFPSMLRSLMLAEPASRAEEQQRALKHHNTERSTAAVSSTDVCVCVTDDDGVVIGDEHLAVHVDELRHQLCLQLSVSPQTNDGDVVHPLVPHCERQPVRVGISRTLSSAPFPQAQAPPRSTSPSHTYRPNST